ncbi:MAG TPA: HAD-IIIC family phosphatase [Mycobacteriales bacterium]|nr:HAD-IIIC family phosphatase [Mycobacteriales bacterium]
MPPTTAPPATGARPAAAPGAGPDVRPGAGTEPAAEPATGAPAGTVQELHRAGRLAADYPAVAGLLTDLAGADLTRAGQLLARLDPAEVLRAHPDTPALTVAVTGHGTLSMLTGPLTAELARHGLLLRPALTDFDSYVFELGDPGSALYAADPDLALCVLDPAVIADELPTPWGPDDVDRVFAAKLALLDGLAGRFAATARGVLVLNTLPLPRRLTGQLIDHGSRARLGATWRDGNAALLRLTERHPALVVLDLDPLVADGVAASDPRQDTYAKAHLSAELLAGYAREVGHLARNVAGKAKKVLVLDLDGTTWGGILGEDGAAGIEVSDSYRGTAHRNFQRVAKQLGAQGVLLAVVSKNELEPVREVLRDHPDMTLREDDLVRVVANWRPKHDNLTELAGALNLGVDSFVFVDDSPYECGLVRHALPGVAVVEVDGEPALHVPKLLADGWFDTRALTAEDRTRVAKYRDELVRKDFLDSFDSIADYLRELRVSVRLAAVTEPAADAARVAQLTLRTNQFNLTTERLQPPQLHGLLADPAATVLAVHARDRFGDNGLVGAAILRRDGAALHIDNFLLSCRVFARGIELACLSAVLAHARATGAAEVFGAYRPTAKNRMVASFYPRNGFQPHAEDGTRRTFRHDLTEIPAPPAHIDLTASLEG